MSTIRRFCFTLNNWNEDERNALVFYAVGSAQFAVIGKEVGDSGTPHLQGYMHLKSPRRFTTIKKICERMYIARARGSDLDNLSYCTKQDKEAYVFGEPTSQGERTDLHKLMASIDEGVGDLEIMRDDPHTYSRHMKFVERYRSLVEAESVPKVEVAEWRPWQRELLDILEGPVDPRKIYWYVDTDGGKGKSFLASYVASNLESFISTGGRSQDIAYAYRRQPIVIFDIPRDAIDFVNYGVLEQLKNGVMSSNKYESVVKVFPKPHVVVFANFHPCHGKFSADRLVLTVL